MVILEELPEVVSHEGVGDLGRMETVDGLNELPELTATLSPLVDDGSERIIDVEDVKVVELLSAGDVGKDSVELALANSGRVTNGGVGVHPSPAGRGLEAVEVVVELSVGDIVTSRSDGMDAVSQTLVQDAAISETSQEQVRALGDARGVQVAKGSHRVVVHLLGGGHASKVVVTIANIVTNESQVNEQGVIVGVVAGKGLDDLVGHRSRASTVDSNVLEIAHRALVTLDVLEVERGHLRTRVSDPLRLMVARGSGHIRPIQLVLQNLQHVLERANADESRSDPLRGDGEVSSGGISKDGDSVGLGAGAQVLLVRVSSGGVSTLDAVAVVIDIEGIARMNGRAARVDARIPIVTVLSAPSVSAELEQGAVSITVKVDKRAMVGNGQVRVLASDLLELEVSVLLGLGLLLDLLLFRLEGVLREQVALRVRAKLDLLADTIRSFLVLKHSNDGRTEHVDNVLAPRLRSLFDVHHSKDIGYKCANREA